MRLYLVQHGEAAREEENPERPLTPKGTDAVARAAAFAAKAGVRVNRILHSGKKRAEQTAEIMASHLKPDHGIEAVSGIAPLDDVRPAAEKAEREGDGVMLVGHLPFMDRLAALLVAGDTEKSVARFRMGGILCLERAESAWRVAWMITDEIV